MKHWKFFIGILALLFVLSSCGMTENKEIVNQFTEWEIHRGVNISHWLSQNGMKESGPKRYMHIQERDFETIASAGFDHIRLPIDEKELWTETGEKIPESFALLHNALQWCRKHNLRVLLDLHIIRSHFFNSEEVNTLFSSEESQLVLLKLWEDLSAELIKYPTGFLAYELMNEPVAPEHEMWNLLVERIVKQIRQTEPERKLFVGSNRWQGLEFLKDLRLPEGDKNLVVSFHFYEPFLLTHYQASWMPNMQIPYPINYPGPILSEEDEKKLSDQQRKETEWTLGAFDVQFLDKRISIAVERAKELGLPLYCGEFGCIYYNVPPQARENWFKDIVSVFDKYNIPFTVWDYKGSFRMFNPDYTPANENILRSMIGR